MGRDAVAKYRAKKKAQREADPETHELEKAKQRAQYAKLSPEAKAKRLASGKAWLVSVWRAEPKKYWLSQALAAAKSRAKRSGLEFSLNAIDCPDTCPALGLPLDYNRGKVRNQSDSPSLDRIDSSKGYVVGNVWVISWRANWLKNNATLAELRSLVSALEKKCES